MNILRVGSLVTAAAVTFTMLTACTKNDDTKTPPISTRVATPTPSEVRVYVPKKQKKDPFPEKLNQTPTPIPPGLLPTLPPVPTPTSTSLLPSMPSMPPMPTPPPEFSTQAPPDLKQSKPNI